ncbi:hypothetical protein OS175_04510 [Marinicella sp. S1101]|uniref:hypothetical protein n=1 Tax=Marinicella marina TaxID=2996016 RepID=UPI002260914F|nr:hypothetical protein [Marinicella marina]MCX7553129.1 hypothetical protein [Marinicella marina]MDJ1138861.1 hypothetical protein [Marinicella marina]
MNETKQPMRYTHSTKGIFMKSLFSIGILLILVSCGSQQEFKGDVVMTTMVNRIKAGCDGSQSCIRDMDKLANACQNKHAIDLPEPDLSDHRYLRVTYEFNACMMAKIDFEHKVRMAKALPSVKSTVNSSASAGNVKISQAYETDPGYLQVRQVNGQFKIEDKLLDVQQIKGHITNNNLTETYHSAALIVSGDLQVGDLIVAQDQIKAAGFKHVYIARE